jgi:hypothetical protein
MGQIQGNPYGAAAIDRPSANGDAHMVSGTRLRYRREFTDPTLAAWDVVTGSGHAVNVTGGNLTVTTGTTINTETSLTTKQAFSVPFKAQFGFKISQKIANQDFFCELIACGPEGTSAVDETVVAAWRISGTDSVTTTVARAEVRNGQAARSQSANLTVATQTTDSIYEIVLDSDEVVFHNKGIDSSASKTVSYVRNSVAPDPNQQYKIRYRIANTGTAPASTTTFTAGFVTAVDYTEIMVELTGGPGSTLASASLPVNITGGSVSLTQTTIQASSTVTGTAVAKVLAAASTNATVLKASAGRIYGYHLTNNTAATKFVRLHNLATAPTVGTSVPTMVIPIAPNSTAVVDHTIPISFSAGISYSITGAFADLDATAVAAGDVVGHILYL